MVVSIPKVEDNSVNEIPKSSVTQEEKDEKNSFCISSIKISAGNLKKKKLLVLDINGLLVDIISPPPKHVKADASISRKACKKF